MISDLHVFRQHAPLPDSNNEIPNVAAGVRKHGAMLQYSLVNDSDVAVVRSRDMFYRCLKLRGWRLCD